MTAFLTAHAGAIFWTGVVIETIGFVWFLFDSYRCDVDIARWTLVFPPLGIYLVFRYPEECLKSFLVCIVGLTLMTVGEQFGPQIISNLSGSGMPPSIESQLNQ